MIGPLFDTTWGRIRLWCSSFTSVGGRNQVVHELATGDEHPVEDRGQAPKRFRAELQFAHMDGQTSSPLERLMAFDAAVARGSEELLQHPIGYRLFVKVGSWEYSFDEDSNVGTATVEFYASSPIEAVTPAGPGTSAIAGTDLVAARAEEMSDALGAVDIESTLPAEMVAAQDTWTDTDDVPTRDILVQLASFSDRLSSLASMLEDDLAYFEAWRSTILMGEAFRNAALAATSDTASVFVLRIVEPVSLLALCARIYGGADAEDYERKVRSLNDVRTPGGLLESNTELVMPARPTSASLRL